MTTPTIDALPTPPSRSDSPDDFVTKADALLGALPTFVTQANAMAAALDTEAAAVDADATSAAGSATAAAGSAAAALASATQAVAAAGYLAVSSTSFSIGTGSKTFAIGTGKSFQAAGGDAIVVKRLGDGAARMYGVTTGYSGGNLTVNVTSVLGSGGPYTDWIVTLQAFDALAASTVAQFLAGASALVALTPASAAGTAAFVPLTDAPTVTWDIVTNGANAALSLGASGHTISAPTLSGGTPFDGCPAALELIGNNYTPTWSTGFDWGAVGIQAPTAGTGKRDIYSFVYRAATGKWRFLGISRGA